MPPVTSDPPAELASSFWADLPSQTGEIIAEVEGTSEPTPMDYELAILPSTFQEGSIVPADEVDPAPSGPDYHSAIGYRHSSTFDPRNADMVDHSLMFLRDLISRLDPRLPDSLDSFIADANSTLDFLAHFGLDEADLRLWEGLCREAEFSVHRLRSLTTVRARTSLADLRDQVRVHSEAVKLAQEDIDLSMAAMNKYRQTLATSSSELESIAAKVKKLWSDMKNLMSCKTDIQAVHERRMRVMEREQARYQLRLRAKVHAEALLTRSMEGLRIAEAEHQTLVEALTRLRDLQSRLE